MTDTAVVNVFLTLRVLLVGGFLLALPHFTRRGLLFGVYVGEEFAGTATGRQLLRSWRLGCLSVMAIALVVGFGISSWGRPVTGNLPIICVVVEHAQPTLGTDDRGQFGQE